MAALTTKEREALPNSDFAVIQRVRDKSGKVRIKRRFPMPDKSHAEFALTQISRADNLSPQEKEDIRKKAYTILYGTTNRAAIAKIRRNRA